MPLVLWHTANQGKAGIATAEWTGSTTADWVGSTREGAESTAADRARTGDRSGT